jgi:DnaJ like chaperone protein
LKIQIALVGALIGFLAGGPVGGIVGFLIGMYVEYISKDNENSSEAGGEFVKTENGSQPNDFGMALLILIAAIMNADGTAMKSELDLVKRMLVRTYGEARAQQMLLILRELIKQKQDVSIVCRQIRLRMVYSQRLELMHVLFRISRADNDINAQEIQMLSYIAVQLGITTPDFMSLRAMFITTPDSDYKILDVSPGAEEDEVKKAYRKMAMRFHPDRLQGLSENEKKAAQEKFLRVKKAYDAIKARKGWK